MADETPATDPNASAAADAAAAAAGGGAPADAGPEPQGVDAIEGAAADALGALGGALGGLGGPPAPAQKPPVDTKTVDAAVDAAKNAAQAGKAAIENAAEAAKNAAKDTASQAAKKFKDLTDRLKANGPMMYLLTSIVSPDVPTRRAGLLFYLASFTAISITWTAVKVLTSPKPKEGKAGSEEVGDFLDRQAEFARRKASTIDLGEFTFDVKHRPDEPKPKGVFGMAVVTLMAECDAKETCQILEEQIPIVRNHVLNALSNIEREELLSRDGKKKVRKAVMDRINTWLPRGRVDQVYVTKLVVAKKDRPTKNRRFLAHRSGGV
ncbi:MAG: flagellar basal body-associated FliL family protein [Bdellovibrionales bacterium]|nr:flagellar basal body-associated FliL family protein [Bdellovibrionales bacterium]